MLTVFVASTATLTATLRNAAGAAQTGAVVTVTIRDGSGVALVTNAAMADAGAGAYTYTIASNLLPTVGAAYIATVTAVKSGETRTAILEILVEVDRA